MSNSSLSPPIAKKALRRINRLYFIALFLIALSISLSQGFVQTYLAKQLHDAENVNVAGRQRMLSQKLSKEVLQLTPHNSLSDRNRIIQRLSETYIELKGAHENLSRGKAKNGDIQVKSETLNTLYDDLKIYYQSIEYHSREIINILQADPVAGFDELGKHKQAILEVESSFLHNMNKIVNQYELESQAKLTRLQRIEFSLSILSLLILTLELFFIFRPGSRQMQSTLNSLVESQEQIHSHKIQQYEYRLKAQTLKASMIVQGQEKERQRIAQDIHEGIGQTLSALQFQVEALRLEPTEKSQKRLEFIKNNIKETIKDLRLITTSLMPNELRDFGLVAALRQLAINMSKLSDIPVEFRNPTHYEQRLLDNVEISLFRIVEDAVSNAIKYTTASQVNISLYHSDSELQIVVEHDGQNKNQTETDAESATSAGQELSYMQERANLIGGTIQIFSYASAGTKVQISYETLV